MDKFSKFSFSIRSKKSSQIYHIFQAWCERVNAPTNKNNICHRCGEESSSLYDVTVTICEMSPFQMRICESCREEITEMLIEGTF